MQPESAAAGVGAGLLGCLQERGWGMLSVMLRATLLVGLGGFLGANLRYWLGGWIAQKIGLLFPIETMLINISGSFLLGLFMTLALHYTWSPEWRQAIAVGFIGSFTTYSTYEYESLRLLQEGLWLKAGINLFGSLLLGLIAVILGVALGRWLIGGAEL